MASARTPNSRSKNQGMHLERPAYFKRAFYEDIIHNQQTDSNGEMADMILVCDGGTIRTHAFILSAASEFLKAMIFSQGKEYLFTREVLIPDFSVKEIENMISLIYKGYVDLRNEKEAQTLQETLDFFQVKNAKFSKGREERIVEGSLKIQELNRIPQDIFKPEVPIENDGSRPRVIIKSKIGTPPVNTDARRSRRSAKPVDPDYMDSGDDSDDASPRKRGGRPQMKNVVVKISPMKMPGSKPKATTSVANSYKPTFSSNGIYPTGEPEKEDSGTDTEDEGWTAPEYKNKNWFDMESRRCQSCEKVHDKAAQASLCVTSHKALRCYFCFRVYSTTDILFKHFKRRHKQAGRENTLICPFCDQAVPYKSVSCHVISVHLRTEPQPKIGIGNRNTIASMASKGPGRPPTVANTPVPATPVSRRRSRSVSTERIGDSSSEAGKPTKKLKAKASNGTGPAKTIKKKKKPNPVKLPKKTGAGKNKVLKVPDLNFTLEKVSLFGRRFSIHLNKKRFDRAVDHQ